MNSYFTSSYRDAVSPWLSRNTDSKFSVFTVIDELITRWETLKGCNLCDVLRTSLIKPLLYTHKHTHFQTDTHSPMSNLWHYIQLFSWKKSMSPLTPSGWVHVVVCDSPVWLSCKVCVYLCVYMVYMHVCVSASLSVCRPWHSVPACDAHIYVSGMSDPERICQRP